MPVRNMGVVSIYCQNSCWPYCCRHKWFNVLKTCHYENKFGLWTLLMQLLSLSTWHIHSFTGKVYARVLYTLRQFVQEEFFWNLSTHFNM